MVSLKESSLSEVTVCSEVKFVMVMVMVMIRLASTRAVFHVKCAGVAWSGVSPALRLVDGMWPEAEGRGV